ncbi:cystathionine beta-lyase [Paremcibacter congregatus]|uniref:Cystathionine beta-lyase n=1 Tax=Paremcibacter congregatus TaxID=2043170 RepID=A0A2G4YM47_9PROT|nr:cystathionine beta-lyase [Paremcibacter congregatus]PHZ83390.1 cystathionine beta-lyase [Paremcibacter congregatus]QDE28140.1 cystathionine beta-lyase [Paremcibacter congregatus]
MKKDTLIATTGRNPEFTHGSVNTPVYHTSTVTFDTVKDMKRAIAKRHQGVPYYGRRGNPTTFALEQAMCDLEGADGCYLYPSGLAAITGAILSFIKAGDHILIADGVYEPTRGLADKVLLRMGVEVSYFDPLIGAGIADLIRDNTRIVFVESPCSLTMEIIDIPAITKAAHARDVLVMMDNTWGTPLHFKPFDHGVDFSIHAATKYIVGHSDAMLGTVSTRKDYCEQLFNMSYQLGYCAAPDDAYLALRGIRTLKLRLKQHEENALTVARWLKDRPEVAEVRHPAFETCPGHEIFKRDFTGGNGLFSMILKGGSEAAVTAFLENLHHFKMGFSWGGYESLILPYYGIAKNRSATGWRAPGPLIRLHIGLEDPQDLITDLAQGLAAFNDVT